MFPFRPCFAREGNPTVTSRVELRRAGAGVTLWTRGRTCLLWGTRQVSAPYPVVLALCKDYGRLLPVYAPESV